MDANAVKVAWILGGAIVLGGGFAGAGLVMASRRAMQAGEQSSERLARAIEQAPRHIEVTLGVTVKEPVRVTLSDPLKVGFEPKLPISVRVENGINEHTGQRAQFELQLGK